MFELFYPDGPAPMIPAPNARDTRNPVRKTSEEMFPVVEENGLVVGMARRSYCHNGSKLLHPVVHLHILDRMGRIYLQKRSMTKQIQPGRWDTAVGGHISYGESVAEALYRETAEELSLVEFNPVYVETYVFESEVDRELVNVFAAVGSSFNLVPDPDEIDEGRFWDIAEIDSRRSEGIFTPNFLSEFDQLRNKLLALL